MGGRKQKFKQPNSGLYILGEGITEQFYFSHLKQIYHFTCTIRPRFFCNTCITDLENRIKELLRGDIFIICVYDADISRQKNKENQRIQRVKLKYSKNKNVIFCDSLPSIEYWFLLHYKDTCPHFESSKAVEKDLKKYITEYEKTENFLKNEKWVRDMSLNAGSIKKACQRAQKYENSDAAYSNIYKSINRLFDTVH